MISKYKIQATDIQQGALLEIRPIDKSTLDEPPHRHLFQEIIFFISGKGAHSIDGQVFRLTANTIYLIGQGQVHVFQKGENLKGFVLRYKEDLLPPELTIYSTDYSLLQMLTNSNALSLSKEEVKTFKQNFEELLREHTYSMGKKNTDTVQLILLTILSRIKHKIRATYEQNLSKAAEGNDIVNRRFILMIEDHYKSNHDLSFYCQNLGVTKRKLLAITQEKFGQSPKELLNHRLMTEAIRLLKYTDLNLKEISFELGYTEPAYFSRLFKIKKGMSPRKYREEYKYIFE